MIFRNQVLTFCVALVVGEVSVGFAAPKKISKLAKASGADDLVSLAGKMSYTKFEVVFKKGSETEDAYTRFKKMEGIRSQAQESLERLMRQHASPELSVRYAELFLQRGRDQESFGLELEMNGNVPEGQKLSASSKSLLRTGLAMHEKNIKNLKNDLLKSEVYLGMSRTERSLGNFSLAMNYAEKGLDSKSKISTSLKLKLLIALGDAAFDMAKATPALKAYREALPIAADGELEKAYLQYKIAWALYNLKDSVAAVSSLKQLIDSNRDRFALKQEAIRDYGLMASDLSKAEIEAQGGIQGIYSYLSKASDSDLPEKALERMAKTLASNGRRQEASEAMLFLIEAKPKDRSNVDRALLIVDWEKDLVEKWKLRDRYLWILNTFGPGSKWFQESEHDVQMVAKTKIEASVRSFATGLHKEAEADTQQSSRDEKLMIVAKLYDAHLKAFSEEPRIYYYRAEIHRHFEEWALAGQKYERYLSLIKLVGDDELTAFDKKTKKEVLEANVEVWQKAAKADARDNEKFLAAVDLFVQENPKDARSPRILFSAAKSSFENKNSAAALIRLERIINEYPKTQSSVDAVDAALDVFNKEGDWVNLAVRARSWLNSASTWAPANLLAREKLLLEGILAKTEAKACEQLSKTEDHYLEAALCYESFANGFAGDPLASKALYEASLLYQKTKRSTAELDVLEDLIKRYPKSPEADGAFGTLATAYEKNFSFDRASEIYEILLTRPNLKNRESFLQRLLTLLQGTGQQEKLQKWLKDPMVKPQMRRQIMSVEYREAFSHLREEELSKGYEKGDFASATARDLFKQLTVAQKNGDLEFYQILEIQRFKGNLLREKGRLAEADKEWMEGLRSFWAQKKHSDLEWESAARLRLDQASFWLIPFEAADLKKNAQKKVELFTKLESWYAEVIAMKSPTVALEALWKSSQLYSSFSKELASLKETKAQAEELSKKSKLALEQLSSRARDWKIISPAILAAINLNRGTNTTKSSTSSLKAEFPWSKLPLWIEPNSEWKDWSEWKLSKSELTHVLSDSNSSRKSLRRAALATLVRDGVYSDESSKNWISTMGDKSSIQIRIQALVNTKSYQLASLYLDQYQELFGKDAFSSYIAGSIMWSRGDYKSAYDYWVRKNSYSEDFSTLYWKYGWEYVFANLGVSETQALPISAFEKLSAQAKETWQKDYLALLCLKGSLTCEKAYSSQSIADFLMQDLGELRQWQSKSGDSAFSVRLEAIDTLFEKNLPNEQSLEQLKPYKDLLSVVWNSSRYALSGEAVKAQHSRLKIMLDKKQNEIEAKLKNDLLLTSKSKKVSS